MAFVAEEKLAEEGIAGIKQEIEQRGAAGFSGDIKGGGKVRIRKILSLYFE